MTELEELEVSNRIKENKFNKALKRRFHVTPAGNLVIRSVTDILTLTLENQDEILQCLETIQVNKYLGIESNFLEKLALEVLFRDSY